MSYIHLTESDRHKISHLNSAGFSLREIARRINRHHTTISRELHRNGIEDCDRIVYWDNWTHPIALKRRCEARHHRRNSNQDLVKFVERKLKEDWAPETIAQKLKADYPDNDKMRVSHETIYRWIYSDAKDGGTLYKHLRRRRKKRRKQKRYGSGRRFIPGRVSIAERPAIVDSRERFGDWEAIRLRVRRTADILPHMLSVKAVI